MTEYIALIHKEPGSDYGVSFPDFPGCITAGTTVDEARRMAELKGSPVMVDRLDELAAEAAPTRPV